MDRMVITLIGVCNLSLLVRAMIVTRYVRTPVLGPELATSDVLACGELAEPIDYCAARVTDTTCEPLTRDWCEFKDMSMQGTYVLKNIITHLPELTNMQRYKEPVPMKLTVGSEVEMKLVLRTGWQKFRCNLLDANGNTVLHTSFLQDSIYFESKLNGTFGPQNTITRNNYPDTEYTLTIRYGVDGFQIYRNDEYIWTYISTQQLISSITFMDIKFSNINGDLYFVAYKYGA